MSALDALVEAIGEALGEHTTIDVVTALAVALVALLEDRAKNAGHDPSKQIVLNGGEHSRKIVIHALGDD